jgi:dTMP kinase
MAPARFITFEGGEGSGKSTQARLLADQLQATGVDVLLTREPGGSPFAEQVRALILDPATAPHSALSEALLFYAARADHLDKTIRPALGSGRWVICDRFSDSTRVYQSIAGGVDPVTIEALEGLVVAATVPDLTFILDLAPAAGLARASARRQAGVPTDAYETRGLDFHERLRSGYLAIAAAEPRRCVLLDGALPVGPLAELVWAQVDERLMRGGA